MKKLIPLATILITCFGFIAVEAQADRGKDPNVPCVVVTGATKETKVVVYRAGDDRRYKEFLRVSLSELKKHPERSPLLQRNDIVDVGPAGILIPPTSPPPKFDAPRFDKRPTDPSTDRVKSGIATL